MKKKILVISWFYPPINSSEGLVTFKLINNSKFEYDVFTQGTVEDWTYGSNVNYKNNDNVKVISSSANYIPFWVEEAVEYFRKNRDKYDAIMTRTMPQECHVAGIKIKKEFPVSEKMSEIKFASAILPFIKINLLDNSLANLSISAKRYSFKETS